MKKHLAEEEAKQVETRNRSIMLDLIPKVDEACRMLKLMNRSMMRCEAMLRVGLAEDNSFQTPERSNPKTFAALSRRIAR